MSTVWLDPDTSFMHVVYVHMHVGMNDLNVPV